MNRPNLQQLEYRQALRSLGWAGLAGYWRPPNSTNILPEEVAFRWLEKQRSLFKSQESSDCPRST